MSNEIAIRNEDDFSKSVSEIQQIVNVCNLLMNTPHYQKLGKEGVFAIVSFAKSIEMNLVHALNGGLYFIKGKVGMSAEAMMARMRKAGVMIDKDEKSDDTICILHATRPETGAKWTTKFSIADAKKAGIYQEGGTWGKYPGTMCYNRAATLMYRQFTPELSLNQGYDKDELEDIANATPQENKITDITSEVQITNSEPKPERVKDALERIDVGQVYYITKMLEGDDETKTLLLERMAKNGVNSIEEIYSSWYEKVIAMIQENQMKKKAM